MKKKRKRILVILLVLAVTVGAGVRWKLSSGDNPANGAQATVRVVRRDLSSTVLATGAVKPQVGAEVRVGARMSGKVERLHANIGDVVEKGQVIAEVEKVDLKARVRQREAELRLAEARLSAIKTLRPREIKRAQAEIRQREAEVRLVEANLSAIKSLRPREIEKAGAEVAQWQASVELYEKDVARQRKLLEQDFTSQQASDRAREQLAVGGARLAVAREALQLATIGYREDLRQAECDIDRAGAVLAASREAWEHAKASLEEDSKQATAEIERAEAALADANAQLSYATITAPMEGVIASVATQEGETVAAGLNAPTFVTIIDLGRLQVDTLVDEVDIGKVRVGQEAAFTVDTFPDREFKGRVTAIYPTAVIQENVVNYDVVVEITSDYENLLRPEMTTNVTIFLETRPDVLAVPARALHRQRGRNIVNIQTPDGPRTGEVKVGRRDGQWVEILEGLSEGQTVFLEPPASAEQGEIDS